MNPPAKKVNILTVHPHRTQTLESQGNNEVILKQIHLERHGRGKRRTTVIHKSLIFKRDIGQRNLRKFM